MYLYVPVDFGIVSGSSNEQHKKLGAALYFDILPESLNMDVDGTICLVIKTINKTMVIQGPVHGHAIYKTMINFKQCRGSSSFSQVIHNHSHIHCLSTS